VKPEDLRFAETHEWVHLEGDNVAVVGISAHAVEALTDLVHIELPEVGKKVEGGQSFAEIESVKAVSDIYAPVAGEVAEINEALRDDLDQIGSDPYGKGWIAKIKTDGSPDLSKLMDYAAYQKMAAEEG